MQDGAGEGSAENGEESNEREAEDDGWETVGAKKGRRRH